jgi:glutamine amidotransferase
MIALIDYEIGNLGSVAKAIERVGGQVQLADTPEQIDRADKLILPGVAAFGDAMQELDRKGLVDPIRSAIGRGVPYLGFCLGLQLLFETSYEAGRHEGLGLLAGEVVRFDPAEMGDDSYRVPHMGWNQLHPSAPCAMLDGVPDGSYVYFAHSYHVVPADENVIATRTDYGIDFVSSVCKDNIFATQFHPEKSQDIGMTVLRNFVNS